MVSPRERSRPARRRIAGERSRAAPATPPPAASPEAPAPESPTGVPADRSTEPTERPAPTDESSPEPSRSIREGDAEAGPPTWVLALLAGLLVVALALDGFVVWRELSQRQAEEQSARALHSALIQAPAVAEQAAEAVLSYRYDTLDKDVAQARRYLSDGYRPDYVASIREVVQAPAKEIGAVVEANVLASGVVEASGERSDVLLFVNQTTTSAADAQPQEALNRVVLTMIRQDGRWVVDEVQAF